MLGRSDITWSAFESVNYPGRYIHQRDALLYLDPGGDDLFNRDATFQILPADARDACAGTSGWKGEYWDNRDLNGAPQFCPYR